MMGLRITIGVIVVVIISAWAYYVDNKSSKSPEADTTETTEENS